MKSQIKSKHNVLILYFFMLIAFSNFKLGRSFLIHKDNPSLFYSPYLTENFSLTVNFRLRNNSPGVTTSQILGVIIEEPYGNTSEKNYLFPYPNITNNPTANNFKFSCSLTNTIGTEIEMEAIYNTSIFEKQGLFCRFKAKTFLILEDEYSLVIATNSKLTTTANFFKGIKFISAFSEDSLLNNFLIEDFVIIDPFSFLGNYKDKNLVTSVIKVLPATGPCASAEDCSNIYLGNELEINIDCRSNIYIVENEVTFTLIIPFNTIEISNDVPLTIESLASRTSNSDSLNKKLTPKEGTSLDIQMISPNTLVINNIGENLSPSRKFTLRIKGLKVKNVLPSSLLTNNIISFRVYYKNSFNIVAYNEAILEFSKVKILESQGEIRHPEDWSLFQNGAWPLQFTFNFNSNIKEGGILKIQHKNAKYKSNLFFFIASTCDFSITTTTGSDIFSNKFGERPTCRPVRTNLTFPNFNTANKGFDGSGIYFKFPEIKANVNYSFIVWGYADMCGDWSDDSVSTTVDNIDGTKSLLPNPTVEGESSKTRFQFKYELYSKIDTSKENEESFVSEYIIAESDIVSTSSICYGAKSDYNTMTSTINGLYDNVTLAPYKSSSAPNDWQDVMIYKEFYDFELGLSYKSDLYKLKTAVEIETYCENNQNDSNCYLVNINKYNNRFKNLYLNSNSISSIKQSLPNSGDKHFLLRSNIEIINTIYRNLEPPEGFIFERESDRFTIRDLTFENIVLSAEQNSTKYDCGVVNFSSALSVLPLPVYRFVNSDKLHTKYQSGKLNFLITKQFFQSVEDTTDCTFSWASNFNKKDKENDFFQQSLLPTDPKPNSGEGANDDYNLVVKDTKNYIKFGETILNSSSGLKIDSLTTSKDYTSAFSIQAQESKYKNIMNESTYQYQKLNIMSTQNQSKPESNNSNLYKSQASWTFLVDLVNFELDADSYNSEEQYDVFASRYTSADPNRLFEIAFSSNCIKLRDNLDLSTFKSIYTYFDFQVQWIVNSPDFPNGEVNRNMRFIKLYPEIGIFNSLDTAIKNSETNLIKSQSTMFAYKYRLSYEAYICFTIINAEAVTQLSTQSTDISSLYIFLNSASLFETDKEEVYNYYPVSGINQAKVQAFAFNSAHPFSRFNHLAKERKVTSTETSDFNWRINRLDFYTVYEYLTSNEYVTLHSKNQTFYHLYLGPALLLHNSVDNKFSREEVFFTSKDPEENVKENNQFLEFGIKDIIIPTYCPCYSTSIRDVGITYSDAIKEAFPARINPSIIFNSGKITSTNFTSNTLINVGAFKQRTDLNNNLSIHPNDEYYKFTNPYFFYNMEPMDYIGSLYPVYFSTFRYAKFLDYSTYIDNVNFCLGGKDAYKRYSNPYVLENNLQRNNYNLVMVNLKSDVSILNNDYYPSISTSVESKEIKLTVNVLPSHSKYYLYHVPFNKFMAVNLIGKNIELKVATCKILDDNGFLVYSNIDSSTIRLDKLRTYYYDAMNPNEKPNYITGIIREEISNSENIGNISLINSIGVGFFRYEYYATTDGSGKIYSYNRILQTMTNLILDKNSLPIGFLLDYEPDQYTLDILTYGNESENKNDKTSSQTHELTLRFNVNKGSVITFTSVSFNSDSLCGMEATSGFLDECLTNKIQPNNGDSYYLVSCIYNYNIALNLNKLKVCCYNTDNSISDISLSNINFFKSVKNIEVQNNLVNSSWIMNSSSKYTIQPTSKNLNSNSGLSLIDRLNISLVQYDQASNKGDYGILRLYVNLPKSPVRNSILTLDFIKFNLRVKGLKPDCRVFHVKTAPIDLVAYNYYSAASTYGVGKNWEKGDFLIENCTTTVVNNNTNTSTLINLTVKVYYKDLLYKCGLTDFNQILLIELFPVKLYDFKGNIGGSNTTDMKYYFNLNWQLQRKVEDPIDICLKVTATQPINTNLPVITNDAIPAEDKENVCIFSIEAPYIESKFGVYRLTLRLEQFVELFSSNQYILNEVSLYLPKIIFGNLDNITCFMDNQELICKEHLGFVNIQLLNKIQISSSNTSNNTFIIYLSGIPIVDLSRKIFANEANKLLCSVNSYTDNVRKARINGFINYLTVDSINFINNKLNSSGNNTNNYNNPINIRLINISYTKETNPNDLTTVKFIDDFSYAMTNKNIREKTSVTFRVALENSNLKLPLKCEGLLKYVIQIPEEYSFVLPSTLAESKKSLVIRLYIANDDGSIKFAAVSNGDFIVDIKLFGKILVVYTPPNFVMDYQFRYWDITLNNVFTPLEELSASPPKISVYNDSMSCVMQNYSNLDNFKGEKPIASLVKFLEIAQSRDPDLNTTNYSSELSFTMTVALILNHRGIFYSQNTEKIYFDIFPTSNSLMTISKNDVNKILLFPGRYYEYKIKLKNNSKLISNTIIDYKSNISLTKLQEIDQSSNKAEIQLLSGSSIAISSKMINLEKNIHIGTSCDSAAQLLLVDFKSSNSIYSDLNRIPLTIIHTTIKEKIALYFDSDLKENIDTGTKLFMNSRNFFYYGLSAYNYNSISVKWKRSAENPLVITSPVISPKVIKSYFSIEVSDKLFSGETKFIPSVENNSCFEFSNSVRVFQVSGVLTPLGNNIKISDVFKVSYNHDQASLDEKFRKVNILNDDSRNLQSSVVTNEFNPGNFDFSDKLTTLVLEIDTPISSPLFLFCTLICQKSTFMTDELLNSNPAIIKDTESEKNIYSYINSVNTISLTFENLLRGNEYKLKCLLSSTEYNKSDRNVLQLTQENIKVEGTIDKLCSAFKFKNPLFPEYQYEMLLSCQELFASSTGANNFKENGCLVCIDKNGKVIEGYEMLAIQQCEGNTNEVVVSSNNEIKNNRFNRFLQNSFKSNNHTTNDVDISTTRHMQATTSSSNDNKTTQEISSSTTSETSISSSSSSSSDNNSDGDTDILSDYLKQIELKNNIYSICVYQQYTCSTKAKKDSSEFRDKILNFIELTSNEKLKVKFNNDTFDDYIGGSYINDTLKINHTKINFTSFNTTDDNIDIYTEAKYDTYLQCYMRVSKDYNINNPPTKQYITSCLGKKETNCDVYFISPDPTTIYIKNLFTPGQNLVWSYCEYNIRSPSSSSDVFVLYQKNIPVLDNGENTSNSSSIGVEIGVNCNPNLGIPCRSDKIFMSTILLLICLLMILQ